MPRDVYVSFSLQQPTSPPFDVTRDRTWWPV